MTKEAAAASLGIGVRTLQRMMSAGEIEYTTRPNPRGGSLAVFDEAEVERVKAMREHRPAVVHPANALQSRNGDHAIATNGHQPAELEETLNRFILALSKRDTTPPPVGAAHVIWLTRRQAVELSGLPKGVVFDAIAGDRLPSIKTGAGYRIKRSDLVTWAEDFTL